MDRYLPYNKDILNLNVLSVKQIISKEIEANEWKRKYEESRVEVLEMRYCMNPFLK